MEMGLRMKNSGFLMHNIIPDMLSRDWHLSDTELMHLFTHLFPTQLHPNFKISSIPTEIDSLLCSILRQLPKIKHPWAKPKPSGYGLGNTGVNSCHPLGLQAMSFWMSSQPVKDNLSWLHSPNQFETQNIPTSSQKRAWLQARSRIPLDTYHRPSRLFSDLTPVETLEEIYAFF